jgi:ATP-dependent DNA helicase RecG
MNHPREKSPAELLATPVQFLKGVGPARAELLERMELRTAADVLFFFPRDYEDMSELRSVAALKEGAPVSVCGVIEEVDQRDSKEGRSLVGALIRDGNHYLRALWFNQPYMVQRLQRGRRVLFSGVAKMNGGRWEMVHPKVEFLVDDAEPPSGRILPVYSLTEGLHQHQMRRIAENVVQSSAAAVPEAFPEEILQQHRLAPIHTARPEIHNPTSRESSRRGAGSSFRSCSSCNWRWRCGSSGSRSMPPLPRCRWTPRSTPAFGGCSRSA